MSGDYLTKLRRKPKHVRDNIAFGIAGSFTAVVALFLVFAVHGPKVVDEVADGDNSPRFFETLVDQAKEQLAASQSSFEAVEEEGGVTITTSTPAAGSTGTPAPAITATSSVLTASTSASSVLIATTSSSTEVSR